MRVSPRGAGRCTRWIKAYDRACGKSARYVIYNGNQELCKECYARFKAGRETLFDAGPGFAYQQLWETRLRIAAWGDGASK